jgi:integrase
MAKTNGRKTFRKVITSDELIAQINPENIKLMERFLKNFATKRSPKSVVVYRSNLNIFFVWNLLENDNRPFAKIKKLQMLDFFDYALSELHWSPNRFHQCHSSLSSFSDWIENYYDEVDGYENFRNIVKKIEKPSKEAVREKTVLQKEDIDKIFATLEVENKTQEQCLLALAISCGARVSELAQFTISLIDEENTVFDGLFLETTEKIRTKGAGVTGKMLRKYILKDMFLPYYHKWLDERKSVLDESNQDHDFLFITKDGTPANADRLRDWIGDWGDIVNQPIYPHSLRHYQISLLKRLEIDDDLIVYLTGWAEGTGHTMIAIYNDNELKDAKFACLDNLKAALAENKI